MLGSRGESGRSRKRSLRIFFATDIHGSERCFRKFLAGAATYDADVLVLGGDIVGKGLVPIRSQDGLLTATVRGETVSVPRDEEQRLRDEINRLGFYSLVLGDGEIERMSEDGAYRDERFREAILTQVRDWCDLAAERLRPEVRCVITPGNDDPRAIDAILAEAPRVESPEGTVCDLGPVILASLGDVTPTPWHTEREYEEDELGRRIDRVMDQVPAGREVVLNFHDPPYSSGLDIAPELGPDLRPVLRGGRPSFVPVGSKAVRAAIKRYRPVAGLHGHVHESRGAQKIGRTLCLNPGSDYTADLLRGAIVDFAVDGSCLDFLLTAG